MELKIDSDMLKSPLGIIVAALVVAAAVGFLHWRRSSLIEQGSQQVVQYLQVELPARYVREHRGSPPDPERLELLGQVEVVRFAPSWFFRAGRDDTVRVKTVVRIGTGETGTFYFRFQRTLGEWRLRHETAAPLLDTFD
jgi:hypothetical protein